MTQERDIPQSNSDALVSETYRATADQRAPEHLNSAILRDAARAVRPRYLRSITWTRPLAWAATITLCVALVLEVSDLPTPGPVAFDGDNFKLELQQSEQDAASIAADDAPDLIREEPMPPRASVAAPQSAAAKPAAKQMAAEPELEKRLPDGGRNEPARAREATAGEPSVAEFEIKDADLLRRADAMARMRDGENKEQAAVEAAAFTASEQVSLNSAADLNPAISACDETARSTAESWYTCIQELQDAGFADEAERQGTALRQAFPDFAPR